MRCQEGGWRRDCVRWTFRLADLPALSGFQVLLEGAPLHILVTHKVLRLYQSVYNMAERVYCGDKGFSEAFEDIFKLLIPGGFGININDDIVRVAYNRWMQGR